MRNVSADVYSDFQAAEKSRINARQSPQCREIDQGNQEGDNKIGPRRIPAISIPSSLPCDAVEPDQRTLWVGG
ncbi:hypothetical protein JRQ81_012179 [Phrynocephalus forsythii]|uniref:Uncharacterized protein n=1 Tax=Phrynocephalus forsythii TaxID=171643 RepID=A0A9Q0X5H2_9SAUR|nr:hypothetical protein JRQ81_012179 [Phrynocephalus forsythii]